MSYSNLRVGRASIPGQTYLITTVTAQRKRLFEDYLLGRVVVKTIRSLDETAICHTLALVVMPDHVHWLFELDRAHTLAQTIKLFKGRAATAINTYLKRQGQVWQQSFHDHAVRSDESLIEMARYVIMNPVRAGMIKHIGDYPLWDSMWMDPL